jgi:hypothetical protein
MRDVVILFVHLIVTVVRLAGPVGLRSVVAESVLVKHQLRILNRGRKRAPNLRAADRIIAGLCTLFMRPARVLRSAIVLASYFAYYHGSRTHLGLDKQCPLPRQVSSIGRIIEIPQLGGLHHRYERVAA